MANQPHKHFTAEDIQRYHSGLMSPNEKHAMERAALHDPMLADALEGFENISGQELQTGLSDLNNRIEKRIQVREKDRAPVVWFKRMNAWRAAAMFILVAGAGFIIYQLSLQPSQKEVAIQPQQENEMVAADTITASSAYDSATTSSITKNEEAQTNAVIKPAPPAKEETILQAPVAASPVIVAADPVENIVAEKQETLVLQQDKEMKELADVAAFDARAKQNQAAARRMLATTPVNTASKATDTTDVFSGQILDKANNPVPHALVRNNILQTFIPADTNGYFSILSPDSVIQVEISSVGYDVAYAQLKKGRQNNVTLSPSPNTLGEVVVTGMGKKKSDRPRRNQPPDPADGWPAFFQYLEQNQRMPAGLNPGVKAVVELHFEVNKQGRPENIMVNKSTCIACNAEAIRLINDGPAWIRYTPNIRVRIQVAFPYKP